METPLITYNLKERGRKYRGTDRDYNIPQLVKYINGNECQEKVKNRDLVGFYGHWARRRFGMNPNEGGLNEDGKPFYIEPAIVTTYLKASDNGNIEHKAEFLKTDSGAVAEKLFNSRTGGFSSAIESGSDGWFFYGFDYVLEPNYTNNRGYMLDDCDVDLNDPEQLEKLIYNEQLRGVLYLLDNAEKQAGITNNVIENLRTENEDLLCKLANAERELNVFKRKHKSVSSVFYDDSNKTDGGAMNVLLVANDRKHKFLDSIKIFNETKNLPTFESPPQENDHEYNNLLYRFLHK